MTVKELMDFLKDCPYDAVINLKDFDQVEYYIDDITGFFDGKENVVNFYIH